MPKIPFKLLPASWGLKGRARLRAEAEYYLEGYELAMRLTDIDSDSDYDREIAQLSVKLKHDKITDSQAQTEELAIKLRHGKITQTEHDISKLDQDLAAERISQDAYDKRVATIMREPWVNVIRIGINPENPGAGYFELDWNDEFVEFLQQSGYDGRSDEEIVNKWFNNVCSTVLLQAQADQDYGLQAET